MAGAFPAAHNLHIPRTRGCAGEIDDWVCVRRITRRAKVKPGKACRKRVLAGGLEAVRHMGVCARAVGERYVVAGELGLLILGRGCVVLGLKWRMLFGMV